MNPNIVKINLQNDLMGDLCIKDNIRKLLEQNLRENQMEMVMSILKHKTKGKVYKKYDTQKINLNSAKVTIKQYKDRAYVNSWGKYLKMMY